jgi:tetratricopeptide (TPR) repeat protein
MNTGQSSSPDSSARRNVYQIIAITCLTLMALLWSLDNFFIYFFLGAFIYFEFLVYWNRPTANEQETPQQRASYQRQNSTAPGARPNQPFQVNKPGQIAVYVIAIAFFVITLVVFLVLYNTDFSGDPESWYNSGLQAKQSDPDSAKFYFRKAFTSDPEHKPSLLEYGNVLLDAREYDSALYYFDLCLKIDDNYKPAHYNKALTEYYQQRYEESINDALNLLQRDPEYYDAQVLTGDGLYAQEKYDSAFYWYNEGYDNGVRSAWLSHVLGYLYDRRNETDKAIGLYEEAVNYDSTKTDVCRRLGELLPGKDGNIYRQLAAQ